ncbi:MAG: hypothetical protein IJ253_11980 [Bacteroidaceae bacterium]|nr:hypothetical protein [Bacteroidaceae bacterium]
MLLCAFLCTFDLRSWFFDKPSEQADYFDKPSEQADYFDKPSEQADYFDKPSEQDDYFDKPSGKPITWTSHASKHESFRSNVQNEKLRLSFCTLLAYS